LPRRTTHPFWCDFPIHSSVFLWGNKWVRLFYAPSSYGEAQKVALAR
jgi:hypothetical protein